MGKFSMMKINKGLSTDEKPINLGNITSQSTTEANVGTVSIDFGDGNNYPYTTFIIVCVSDSARNSRHLATTSVVYWCHGVSYSVPHVINQYVDAGGATRSNTYTSVCGVYGKHSSSSAKSINLDFYSKYNSSKTLDIDGNYTAYIYGFNMYDLLPVTQS